MNSKFSFPAVGFPFRHFNLNILAFGVFLLLTGCGGGTNANVSTSTPTVNDGGTSSNGSTSTNSGGSSGNSSTDNSNQPPAHQLTITSQPVSTSVDEGQDQSFNLVLSNNYPVTVSWFKNGTLISGINSTSLVLHSVSAADAATYGCSATDGTLTVTCNSFSLTVNPVASNGPAPGATIVALKVTEPAGVARTAATLRTGVPMPKGTLYPNDTVSLFDGSNALPTQTKVLSEWGDGSIRWLLLDSQADLTANGTLNLSLNKVSSSTASSGISIQTSSSAYTIDTGPLVMEIPRTNGSVISRAWLNGNLVLDNSSTSTLHGPWIKLNGTVYTGANLAAGETPLASDPVAAYLNYVNNFGEAGGFNLYNPYTLNVSIENAGPIQAVVRVSGAFQDTQNNSFSSFIVRLHFHKGSSKVDVDQTLVYTGDRTEEIQGYGFALPFAGSQTSIEGQSVASGSLNQLAWDNYSIAGTNHSGQALGYMGRSDGSNSLGVILRDMAENFPKGLQATTSSLLVNLYPEAAGAWNLARYSDTLDTANGEVGTLNDRGAQGLGKTDQFRLVFGQGSVDNTSLANQAKAIHHGQLLMLASPQWYSDARVMGIGAFTFPTDLATSEGHYRIDRLLHVVADFMRFNQRVQYDWYGIENYGDIRGDFAGGSSASNTWLGLGRYGWSGNSGEPSNQLWTQFLREPSQQEFVDAEALARHTLDVQMVHYGDASSIDMTNFNGRNREFTVGSLHRHGRQAFSGYAGQPEYSHIAGVETYYYLTGDDRAKETLYEAAQFIARFGETTPEYTADTTGIDVLDRAAAVFFDQPTIAARFENRINYLLDYLDSGTPNNLVQFMNQETPDLAGQFGLFVRTMPGLLYRHERTGDSRAADLIFTVADILTNGGDAYQVATNGTTSSVFYHMNTLAYAASIASEYGRDPTPYYNLVKACVEWNTHAFSSQDTDAISLTSLARIPTDWKQWSFSWNADPLATSNPGILWLDRQITFRNDFMQDYHSYRAFIHLATAAALIPAGQMTLR